MTNLEKFLSRQSSIYVPKDHFSVSVIENPKLLFLAKDSGGNNPVNLRLARAIRFFRESDPTKNRHAQPR